MVLRAPFELVERVGYDEGHGESEQDDRVPSAFTGVLEEDETDGEGGEGNGDPDKAVSHFVARHHDSDNISRQEVEEQEPAADQAADACIAESPRLEVAAAPSADETGDGHHEAAHQHPGAYRFGDRFENRGGKAEAGKDRYKYK
jgi:hypothetical protein